MPITDQYQRFPLDRIEVLRDSRQRREIKTSNLRDSIARHGVLQPIIIRRDFDASQGIERYFLVAGERRLETSRELSLPDIPVRFAEDLSPTEAAIFELEENIKRQDLPWLDMVGAVAQIHDLYLALDSEWTQTETAESIGLDPSTISIYLRVWKSRDLPRISECSTIREAWNILARRDARAEADALAELLEDPEPDDEFIRGYEVDTTVPVEYTPSENPLEKIAANIFHTEVLRARRNTEISEVILHESFLEWAPKYSGPRFNFIHCDFPYGISHASGDQGRGAEPGPQYSDEESVYWTLLECLAANLHRIFTESGHMMFWFSEKLGHRTREFFAREMSFLEVHPFPLVWVKSDNAGISPDPRRGPRHIYETALFISRARRQIVQVVGDAYSCPSDQKFHPSTKPESMLRHFFSMLIDEQTYFLDPTCGAGSSIRAAESLRAKKILGMDIDPGYVESARIGLKNFRVLREGEKLVR